MQMRNLFELLPEPNHQRSTDQPHGMWFHNVLLTMLQTFSFIIKPIIFPWNDKNVSIPQLQQSNGNFSSQIEIQRVNKV